MGQLQCFQHIINSNMKFVTKGPMIKYGLKWVSNYLKNYLQINEDCVPLTREAQMHTLLLLSEKYVHPTGMQ